MEYIKKEELIKGEIYNSTKYNHIFKYLDKNGDKNITINKVNNCFYKDTATVGNGLNNIINATSEEKHWLNTCIKLDKFITFEEAMKSFIPEYYEYIVEDNLYNPDFIKDKIYKIINKNNLEASFNFIDEKGTPNGYRGINWKLFKPSTKEAYDAQFVVKEPEFVLPYAWYVVVDKENLDILSNWISPNDFKLTIGGIAGICNFGGKIGEKGHNLTKIIKGFSYDFGQEITFEQFKKYVLKEETPVQDFMKLHNEIIMKNYPLGTRRSVLMDINKIDKEIIEPLPQFKVIETIETITKVENNEGNQFFIGDVVKSLDSVQKGEITKFRYSADKSNIIAITTFQSNNGIGIDKIEHYIEPKDEFILPEKWCITTTAESSKIIQNWRDMTGGSNYRNKDIGVIFTSNKGHIRGWIPEAIDRKIGYTEITFDQFKKYVLKEEVKEETLLEKAKKLYPVGTRYTPEPNNAYFNRIQSSTAIFEVRSQGIFCKNNLGWVFYENKWAEIIE